MKDPFHDLEALYLKYTPAMIRRAARYASRPEDAEDIVSECWLSFLGRLPKVSFPNEKALSTYIMKSVQNTSIDFYRRRRQETIQPIEYFDRSEAHEPLEQVLNRIMIDETSNALPRRMQLILRLALKNYSDEEIAKTLGIQSTSLRVYWHRIRKKLSRD